MKTEHRWIAQDKDGQIFRFTREEPNIGMINGWINNHVWDRVERATPNPNWQESLIDLEKENYKIVNGILERRPKKVKLTDTQLLDAIVEHNLFIDVEDGEVWILTSDGRTSVLNKKGNIRKAIKRWLKENVDKKHEQE